MCVEGLFANSDPLTCAREISTLFRGVFQAVVGFAKVANRLFRTFPSFLLWWYKTAYEIVFVIFSGKS